MNKLLLLFVLLVPFNILFSQNLRIITENSGGYSASKSITMPQIYNSEFQGQLIQSNLLHFYPPNVKWTFQDAAAIGGNCQVCGNGNYTSSAWDLNSKRICLYGNTDNIPFWTFNVPADAFYSYTSISDTGGIIAVSSYQDLDLFNNTSNIPFWTYSLTSLPDTGTAGPIAITSDGNYFIASAVRSDTSTALCFSKNSSSSLWKIRLAGSIYGVNMSRNDSVVIINSYSKFMVVDVYTGNVRFTGDIPYGTQSKQGISGNGDYIAIIDYHGFLRLFQWNGTAYTLKWQFQEPTGTYYNWHSAVDISKDGSHVISGTLVFKSSSSYSGRVRYFNTNSSVPLWVYQDMGDEVTQVQFNEKGNIAVASSWGPLDNSGDDFLIFKTLPEINTPPVIFGLNTSGSMFNCSISRSGTVAVTNGKAVHARAFGNGGLYYNIDIDTSYGPISVRNNDGIVSDYKLYQNYPNPFNPYTLIKFSVPKSSLVTIKVYDMLGREIINLVNRNYPQGVYSAAFDASALPSGIYFYKITAGSFSDVKKMVLVK